MDKYWMLYRKSKRRDLGEDFSNRKQTEAPETTPAIAKSSQPKTVSLGLFAKARTFLRATFRIATKQRAPQSRTPETL